MRYHVFTIATGETTQELFHLPAEPGETREEATERFVLGHPDMVNRQRNRDKTARRIRTGIIGYRLAVPTSERRREAEEAGLPFPAPVGRKTRRGSS